MFRTYNYGAVLQAYATQRYISGLGHDAEIVDYCNKYEQNQIRVVYKEGGNILGYFKSAFKNIILGRIFYCKKGFRNFEQIHTSKTHYENYTQLDNIKYDVLVAGSDQIWNPILTNGLDEGFLLLHGNAKKRVSIASSMGSTEIDDRSFELLKRAVSGIEWLSVREAFAKQQLEKCTDSSIKVLMDPVFLLKSEIWESIASKSSFYKKGKPYILTYFIGKNKSFYRGKIRKYIKQIKLPLWTIQYSNYSWKESRRKLLGLSMEDFLAVILNADVIITDSFHGVAFSLIFEKNFVALTNSDNPIRVKELLSKIGLDNRIDMDMSRYSQIDYSNVRKKLQLLEEDSREWIKGVFND